MEYQQPAPLPGWVGVVPLGGEPAPLPEDGRRQPAERSRRRFVALLLVLCGAAVVAGSFAGWVRADIIGEGIRDGSGWRNVQGEVADGPWFAVLGAVLVLVGMFALFGFVGRWRWTAAAAGIGAVVLGIVEVLDITSPGPGVTTELLGGLWVVIAGGALGALLSLMLPARPYGWSADRHDAATVTDSTGAVGAVG